ncbi:hypothetical protein MAA8898_01734 [Maliponia aquimaris]|uniref:4Fe-4S ferredoxin-type domain-containing protein n=1 Tax=Maliponia aquimaris TaxID=1673631 RepID=A0A238KA06_9RHOB|nr:hypothetical protein MAA8898_01734 [Maliponia aquimaris]
MPAATTPRPPSPAACPCPTGRLDLDHSSGRVPGDQHPVWSRSQVRLGGGRPAVPGVPDAGRNQDEAVDVDRPALGAGLAVAGRRPVRRLCHRHRHDRKAVVHRRQRQEIATPATDSLDGFPLLVLSDEDGDDAARDGTTQEFGAVFTAPDGRTPYWLVFNRGPEMVPPDDDFDGGLVRGEHIVDGVAQDIPLIDGLLLTRRLGKGTCADRFRLGDPIGELMRSTCTTRRRKTGSDACGRNCPRSFRRISPRHTRSTRCSCGGIACTRAATPTASTCPICGRCWASCPFDRPRFGREGRAPNRTRPLLLLGRNTSGGSGGQSPPARRIAVRRSETAQFRSAS